MSKIVSDHQLGLLQHCVQCCNDLIEACTDLVTDCAVRENMHCAQLSGLVDQKATACVEVCKKVLAIAPLFIQHAHDPAAVEAGNDLKVATDKHIKKCDQLINLLKSGSKDYIALCNEVIQVTDECLEVCNRCIKVCHE